MGETLNDEVAMDIDFEKKLSEQTLSTLIHKQVSEKTIRQKMKDLGSERYNPRLSSRIQNILLLKKVGQY